MDPQLAPGGDAQAADHGFGRIGPVGLRMAGNIWEYGTEILALRGRYLGSILGMLKPSLTHQLVDGGTELVTVEPARLIRVKSLAFAASHSQRGRPLTSLLVTTLFP